MTPQEKIKLINSLCEKMTEKEFKMKYSRFEKEVDTILSHLHYDDIEFSFANEFGFDSFEKWKKASGNAVTLWKTLFEWVKVEITPKAVKFFRADDTLSCYTYPPLHELKKDKDFIECVKSTLMESNQYNITEFTDWVNGNDDMPPFPLTCIFASEFQGYKFHDFEEN